MNIYAIISLVAFVLSLILGITVFSLAPRRFLGKAFVSGILLLLIVEFSLFMLFVQKDNLKIQLWGKIAVASFCFLPPTWALISLVYARTNYRELLKRRIWYLSLLYAVGLIFFVLLWKVDFFSIPKSFPKDIILITNLGKYFLIFALLSTVLILVNFENTLRLTKISSRKGKKVPLYVLIGAFLFWIYALSQMMLYSRVSSQLALMGFFVIIFTNIIVMFYSIKYGLMQLEVNLGREVVYSSAMIFIVGVYLLIIGIAGKIVQYAGGSVNLFLTFLAALAIFCILLAILASRSLKERVKLFVDRNFYKNRYDYREQWGQFSESLTAVLNLDEVLTIVIENIARIFSTDRVAILLNDEAAGILEIKKTKNMDDVHDIKFFLQSHFIDWFHRMGEALEVATLLKQADQIGLTSEELETLKKLRAAVCVPMIAHTKFIGLLAIGDKDKKEPYSKEDFDLLETLANQSSVAILNARLNEDLMVSREMASFHKLSSFVLHDLKNSVSMLSMVIKNTETNWDNQEFQKDMLIAISNAVTKIKSLISRISTLPEKLEPRRQMVQINDIIKTVIKEAKIEQFDHIELKDDFQKLPLIAVDAEKIQKVIENLVINAIEALPKGGRLQIVTRLVKHHPDVDSGNGTLKSENSFAEIEISDTGVGMSEEFIQTRLFKPFQTTKKKGLGIGLYHCKEIITAHGGTIKVRSQLNEGTNFRIVIPIVNGSGSTQDRLQPKYEETVLVN